MRVTKGKTYEEMYGLEKAEAIKRSKSNALKGRHIASHAGFQKGVACPEDRKQKISKSHVGKPKIWLRKIPFQRQCEFCFAPFVTKVAKQRFCGKKCATKHNARTRTIDPIVELERRRKISEALKGRVPKNLKERISQTNRFRQYDMFLVLKEFFPEAISNFPVKEIRRWLDVAVPSMMFDFEYDGKVHLMRSVAETDRVRQRQLEQLGWIVIRFNKDNYNQLELCCCSIWHEKEIKENSDVYLV